MALAQAYYDRAWAAHPERTRREESDFYVLQALIYGFQSGIPEEETRQEGREMLAKAREKHALPLESSIHPSWSRQWIDVWLSRFADDATK